MTILALAGLFILGRQLEAQARDDALPRSRFGLVFPKIASRAHSGRLSLFCRELKRVAFGIVTRKWPASFAARQVPAIIAPERSTAMPSPDERPSDASRKPEPK